MPLVTSHRHHPEDLKLWAEFEGADRIHGGRLLRSGKVEKSIAAIRQFAAEGPCFLGWSGGKDSTVMLGLAEEAGLLRELPIVWMRAVPKFHPEVPVMIEAIKRRWPGVEVEIVDYESPVPGRLTVFEAEEIATRNFHRVTKAVAERHGRRIIGVRADESRVRLITMRRFGLSIDNSCRPLGWWNLADVFGYLAVRNLPVPPPYAMLGGGRWTRSDIRIDALMGERGDERGRREWEREYYGDVVRRLEIAEKRR